MARRATARGDNILFTSSGFATNGSYTYCAWVRANHAAAQNTGIYEDTLQWGSEANKSLCVFCWDHDAAGYYGAFIHQGNDESWDKVQVTPLYADHWYHVLCTFDSITGDLCGYRDGSDITTLTGVTGSGSTGGVARIFGPNADNALNVVVAEAAFWSRVLTAPEIAGLADYGRPSDYATGLTFYAPLLGTESPEPDLGPTDYDGVVTGAVQYEHPPLGLRTPTVGTVTLAGVAPRMDLGIRPLSTVRGS